MGVSWKDTTIYDKKILTGKNSRLYTYVKNGRGNAGGIRMSKYKIGQLSKTMGVSTHLLKHYEKFNLVSPVKDDSTNYRYYDIGQCIKIINSKKYRNMGFSIKDTASLLNEWSTTEIDQAVDAQITSLEEQIKELEQQKQLAMQYRHDSEEIDRKIGQWFVQELKEFYFIRQTNESELVENHTLEELGENLLDYVPMIKPMVQLKAKCFTGSEMEYHWGLAIDCEKLDYIKGLHLDGSVEDETITKINKQRAFVTYLKVEIPYMGNGRLTEAIREQYQFFEEILDKDVYAELVKTESVENKRIEYFCIVIPL